MTIYTSTKLSEFQPNFDHFSVPKMDIAPSDNKFELSVPANYYSSCAHQETMT